MDFILAVAPIAGLVIVMVKHNPWPSHIALPVAALAILMSLAGFHGFDSRLLLATVLSGALTAFTPILIIAGAMLLMRFMQVSGAQARVNEGLKRISPNPVAQLMIVGWSFVYFLEGASGFGTPAAICAPILVGMGFPAIRAVMFTLSAGALAVSYGGVGMPMWFGLSPLHLSHEFLLEVGFTASIVNLVAAILLLPLLVGLVLGWETMRQNLGFILASVLLCMVPAVAISTLSTEFPSLAGGLIGLLLTSLLAKTGWGLDPKAEDHPHLTVAEVLHHPEQIRLPRSLLLAMLPLLSLVLILLITRIEPLGIRGVLLDSTPIFQASTGLGEVSLSRSGIIEWLGILQTDQYWSLRTLYIPALIPFVLIVVVCSPMFGVSRQLPSIFYHTFDRVKRPAVAMIGALVMVKLMLVSEQETTSQALIIGQQMGDWMGHSWQYTASILGALGAFFSGSGTVSNLTFGGVQLAIADVSQIDRVRVMAMQVVGGSAGTMSCINSVVAACAVTSIQGQEGKVIRQTFIPLVLYLAVSVGVTSLLFRP